MTLTVRPSVATGSSRRAVMRLAALRLIGRAYPRRRSTGPPRSLLLIRPDHLGDVLFLTPTLSALRLALPGARITLMIGPWSRAVVENNPDIDEILELPFPGFERAGRRGWIDPYRLLMRESRSLRARSFDVAMVMRFDHWWGAWLAAAAGVPSRIGYSRPETNPFLTEALPYHDGRHEVEQNHFLASAVAPGLISAPGPTRFEVSDKDRRWAGEWLAAAGLAEGRPLVAIHPGSGAQVKQWPVSSWAAVGNGLAAQERAAILLTGSGAEGTLCRQLADAMTSAPLDAAGQTSLGRLAALYERCALVMGSDSGPLHLAVATGVRTIHLHGPVDARKFGPWGDADRHVVLTSSWPSAPCNRLDWDVAELDQHACMSSIAPQDVLRVAKQLLAQVLPGPDANRQGD